MANPYDLSAMKPSKQAVRKALGRTEAPSDPKERCGWPECYEPDSRAWHDGRATTHDLGRGDHAVDPTFSDCKRNNRWCHRWVPECAPAPPPEAASADLAGHFDYRDVLLLAEREGDLALIEEAIRALRDLHSLVWGECPSLLNEDSGGDSELDSRIKDVLKGAER